MRTIADITEEDLASTEWTHEDLMMLANNKLNLLWTGVNTQAPEDPLLPELQVVARKVEMMNPKALLAFTRHCQFEREYFIPRDIPYEDVNQATLEEHAETMCDMLYSIRSINHEIKGEMQKSEYDGSIHGSFGRIEWQKSKRGKLKIHWCYNFDRNEPQDIE